jgi:hypothetical protein
MKIAELKLSDDSVLPFKSRTIWFTPSIIKRVSVSVQFGGRVRLSVKEIA